MEVLALDPAQRESQSTFRGWVDSLVEPWLITVAIAKSDLDDPVEMSRIGLDGVRIEWALQFTYTPLFFIDREGSPHVGLAYWRVYHEPLTMHSRQASAGRCFGC
jgi:hypothetical protein